MKKQTMMLVALAMGAGSLAQAQQQADFNFCDWAKDSFTLFDAERDGAENPYIQEFSLKFRGQYQGALVDPAGGTDRLKGGADGRDKRDNNEWRRFRLGAQGSIFFLRYPGVPRLCRSSTGLPYVAPAGAQI